MWPVRNHVVSDIALFIFEASSQLARSRDAVRRHDPRALRAAALALSDASEAAGADRMRELCALLRTRADEAAEIVEELLDELADEFDQVTSDLHTARSA
jgi:HPt (histidine-containing phosphotransfer) domain-containing protein